MKTEKTINLTAYKVEYIDQREPRSRARYTLRLWCWTAAKSAP